MTISHLRFDPDPIDSTYLIDRATFVGVHQWNFLERIDVLGVAAPGATVLINSPYPAEQIWDRLPVEVQEVVIERGLHLHAIDAAAVAEAAGLAGRVNTVMQTCFFALADVLPTDEAIARLKEAIAATYGKRGDVVVQRNIAAVDTTLAQLFAVPVGSTVTATKHRRPTVSGEVTDFVQRVTARMLAGEGDLLPVSALPPDGTFPTGTSYVEKRTVATEIPIWEADLCIDCGKCAIVCPHAAIRMKVYEPGELTVAGADVLKTKSFRSREVPGMSLDRAGRARRLHRVRSVRDRLSGARQERGQAQEHQPAPDRRAPRRRARRVGCVPASPRSRSGTVGSGVGEDQPAAPTAVRVQRSLLGLRRDAVPQAAHAAVRRSPADRQRHRAAAASTAATCRPRRTAPTTRVAARRGATACSRTTPSSVSASGSVSRRSNMPRSVCSTSSPRGAGAARRSGARGAVVPGIDDSGEMPIREQRARVDQLRAALTAIDHPDAAAAAGAGRHAGAQDRVDRRRRRLGLRHRRRRSRSRARQRSQREHPRARHRGVLEHRRSGIEGDTAGSGGQVRGRRQGDRQEGSRPRSDVVRRRLRRPRRARRQRHPDGQGAARGRGVAGSVAGHRLQHVHRPRLRHEPVDDPSEARRAERSLAAVPLPARRRRGDATVPARQRGADGAVRRVRRQRGAVLDAAAQ